MFWKVERLLTVGTTRPSLSSLELLLTKFSTAVIRRGGLWISLQEVEDRLVQLAYISEAYVVKANYNCTQQAAAVVRVSTITDSVNLFKIRKNLHDALPKYKLPTLLRILQEDELIPETSTGKVNRKMIGEKYFPLSVDGPLPPDVEFWDGKGEDEEVDFPRKAWDWGGM
jgi:malonyl-CoA/methylmalonyl-CoA synthetase